MELRSILALLDHHQVDHVVVGGFGVLLPDVAAEVSAVELVPAPDPANLERLTAALLALEVQQGRALADEALPSWRGFLARGRVPGQIRVGTGAGGVQITMQTAVVGVVAIDHAVLAASAVRVELTEPVLTVAVVDPDLLASWGRPDHRDDLAALRRLVGDR